MMLMPIPINFRVITKLLVCVLLTGFVSAEIPDGVLDKLASDQFEVRKDAYVTLRKWAVENKKTSPGSLHKAWQTNQEPEVKTRCYTLMKEVFIQQRLGKGRGFVGVRMADAVLPGKPGAKARAGVQISMVLPKTPAQKSGLAVNDVIVAIDKLDFNDNPNGRGVNSPVFAFSNYVLSKQADDVVTLHIVRNGKQIEKKVTLMKRPASADGILLNQYQEQDLQKAEQLFESWLKEMRARGE